MGLEIKDQDECFKQPDLNLDCKQKVNPDSIILGMLADYTRSC